MSRWSYTVFAIVVLAVVTALNLTSVNGGSGGSSRSWGSGHSSGSGWSSGGGHK